MGCAYGGAAGAAQRGPSLWGAPPVKHAAVLLTCVLTLTACNREPEVDARNASVEDVAEQVAEAGGSEVIVRPGKWESRVQIEEFELPGAPPEARTAMRG